MITLNFNNQSITTEAKSLKDLLAEKSMAEKSGIAVAVNQIIIQKTNWDDTLLQQNDSILIITATQGG